MSLHATKNLTKIDRSWYQKLGYGCDRGLKEESGSMGTAALESQLPPVAINIHTENTRLSGIQILKLSS